MPSKITGKNDIFFFDLSKEHPLIHFFPVPLKLVHSVVVCRFPYSF